MDIPQPRPHDKARNLEPAARFIQQTCRGKGNALAVQFAAATGDINTEAA